MLSIYRRAVDLVSGDTFQSIALFLTRIALAGIFWRSGRTKVEEGSLLSISDTTYFLFSEEYSGVPLPSDIAAVLATYSEHLFPVLLVLGLFTRLSALALLGMTMVIQLFVYPEAWWQVHIIWAAICLILVSHGGGSFTLDRFLTKKAGHED